MRSRPYTKASEKQPLATRKPNRAEGKELHPNLLEGSILISKVNPDFKLQVKGQRKGAFVRCFIFDLEEYQNYHFAFLIEQFEKEAA